MASINNSKRIEVESDEEEEFEHFDDFTVASTWERFISEIEATCRHWLADRPKNLLVKNAVQMDPSKDLLKINSEFKYGKKKYCMEYHLVARNEDKVGDWDQTLHDLQLSFGVKEFVVIAPQSASGVVLDAPEASKLLSAVAIALSNSSCLWPAFVPVHDPSRKAYIGIQNMGTVFTRRFEADRIGSQVPIKLMHLEGLYELFVSKFAYTTVDWSMHEFKVHFKMRLTYRTPVHDDEDQFEEPDEGITGSKESHVNETCRKTQWDDCCPWTKWFSAEDPVKGYELVTVWPEKTAETSIDMAELENASPLDADQWFLRPCFSPNLETSDANTVGLASQLRLLVKAMEMSVKARFIEDFASVESPGSENLKSSAVAPPPTVVDRIIKDLFHEVPEEQAGISLNEHRNSRSIKGAPLQSLFAQFCLHALWVGNCSMRAVAVLWIEFVREVRWCWEELQPLPRMPHNGMIDLTTCLINQKLHMLSMCIERRRLDEHDIDRDDPDAATSEEDGHKPKDISFPQEIDGDISKKQHRNSPAALTVPMMLLKSRKIMHVPITQDPPPMTEDMHEERLTAAEALGDSFGFSAQLEKDILASDMSAFKAANPDAVFEDFIRWHSPKDWESDSSNETRSKTSAAVVSELEWPPRGKLSQRMSDSGNSWRTLWNEALPLPPSQQRPLLDADREGEKVLHYLETLKPYELMKQTVCTSFRAAADTLNQTSFGDFKQMTTKIGQLYATLAATLKYLEPYSKVTRDDDYAEDLRKLCNTFGHIEKLILLAASVHRKFLQSPRLGQAIFSDCFDYYLPYMGTGHAPVNSKKEFDKKQRVGQNETNTVMAMFPTPTANQSWRRVLSMGNLLNGHEPIEREIIFSKRDRASGSYFNAVSGPKHYEQDIETHRMYVSGTSNDLRVALAVTSFD